MALQQVIRHAARYVPVSLAAKRTRALVKRATTDSQQSRVVLMEASPVASTSRTLIEDSPASAHESVSLMPVSVQTYSSHNSQEENNNTGHNARFTSTGLPLPSSISLPNMRHPFNTHKFVDELQRAGFTRIAAEAIMRATKSLLVYHETRAAHDLVGKPDLENEAYLFKAALGELQTEVMVQARNDTIALRSANGQLQREIDNMQQKLRVDVSSLKNEYALLSLVLQDLM